MIDLHPTRCNICGGKVIYTSNARVYGRKYGSGMCYYCTKCGAFVGTHEPHPEVAYGILSNAKMRAAKKKLHSISVMFLTENRRAVCTRKAFCLPGTAFLGGLLYGGHHIF